jgi:imidazolonepropionase
MLIHSAGQLLTLQGGPQRGSDLGRLAIITDGALLIRDGEIQAVGDSSDFFSAYGDEACLDAGGKVVMPGFVDPHTHAVWVGDRAAEFEMRTRGRTYMEIMEEGGGILSTVRATRAASLEEMEAETAPRLRNMLAYGTTTAEVKTGYGLDKSTELRMLEALISLDEQLEIDIVPTFLGAHAVPPEYGDQPDDFIELICSQVLPEVSRWWDLHASGRPRPFVDVFCEKGAFDINQSRRILETAKALNYPIKIHSDEFESLGGTRLAVDLEAVSADHLVASTPEDILAIGKSDAVAVALPCTPFGLGESSYTPAKDVLSAGGYLAIATDLNPGTSWCESMQFVIALSCRYMGLTPAQGIAAATVNAAKAVSLENKIGSLEPGKQADILILSCSDYRHLGYRFGTNLVETVIKKGMVVIPPRIRQPESSHLFSQDADH